MDKKKLKNDIFAGMMLALSFYASYILLWYIVELFSGHEGIAATVLFGVGPFALSYTALRICYRIYEKKKARKLSEALRHMKENEELHPFAFISGVIFGLAVLYGGYFYFSVILMMAGSLWGWLSLSVGCTFFLTNMISSSVFTDEKIINKVLLFSYVALAVITTAGVLIEELLL